jgi:hypothetical protein
VNRRRLLLALPVVISGCVLALGWLLHAHAHAAPRPAVAVAPRRSERELFALMAKSVCNAGSGTRTFAVRGLIDELPQYPSPARASRRERAGAARLLRAVETAAGRWQTPADAAAAGFDTREAKRQAGDPTVHYLHGEHRAWGTDPRLLDPRRPKALIYANAPGNPLLLVGVMFSMPRGVQGPDPGGAITRWHRHHVCARGAKRGLKPLADGSCPPGTRLREGSEMMHIWFTGDLRSAFAIHAPEPELCSAGRLPAGYCAHLPRSTS